MTTISNRIIESLEYEDLAIFEIAKKINKSENVIRNTLNKSLKKFGIVQETGLFKQNPETKSKRGYKIYTLNKEKIFQKDKPDLKHILFLMKFFQKNSKILLKNNIDFYKTHQEQFLEIMELINRGKIQDGR